MKAVRCHRFACVEEVQEDSSVSASSSFSAADRPTKVNFAVSNNQTKTKQKPVITTSYRPRSTPPLPLKECLSLDVVPDPRSHADVANFTINMNTSCVTAIIIQTTFAGIQYPDALQAQGLYQVRPTLPYVPGMDVVGQIVDIRPPTATTAVAAANSERNGSNGNNDSDRTGQLHLGMWVMATLTHEGGTGGLAELVAAPVTQVYPLPLELTTSKIQLAGCANIGRNYFAAYHSLVTVGHIDPNDKDGNGSDNDNDDHHHSKMVLVTGASGGVGMATIELAKAMGCHVIAGVSTPDKMTGPRHVGAHAVFCYGRSSQSRRDFKTKVKKYCQATTLNGNGSGGGHGSHGVDLVIDMVQGDLFEQALASVVKPLGTIALVGFAAGQKPIRPGVILIKEICVVGSIWGRWAVEHPVQHRRNVQQILDFLARGQIRPRVDRIIPLDNFLEAFEIFQDNRGRGNTVVSFEQEYVHDDRSTPMTSRL